MKLNRVIISGGGTGGHIFPAIAIANELKRRNPHIDILFVGALGKMEMEKVPQAGYTIQGLPISGFQRKFTLSNFLLPFKLIWSMIQAVRILQKFKPEVAIGVGGYASGPTLRAASLLGVPTIIQEQNSFPGKTNRILSKKAKAICTAFEGLEAYFPKEIIHLTGNPVRSDMVQTAGKRTEAIAHFKLNKEYKTLLIIGGSLGARTLNQAILHHLKTLCASEIQVIWQCGAYYHKEMLAALSTTKNDTIHLLKFIDRMDLAYAAADCIVSRAGAISVSELCLIGKPVILVPSPNVADDHQTKNALALVQKDAAKILKDSEAIEELIPQALKLMNDQGLQAQLSHSIQQLAKPNASQDIVDVIEQTAKIK
jgi:UDP-N-acetylglucosamine--N-acetylmuramyl-(pentapeptide) pyrophosphoryl-undecaprenol N-acetylglucosamine transferase